MPRRVAARKAEPPLLLIAEPVAVDKIEAARLLSLGQNKVDELIRCGQLPAYHAGRRVVVPVAALREWIGRAAEAEAELAAQRVAAIRFVPKDAVARIRGAAHG